MSSRLFGDVNFMSGEVFMWSFFESVFMFLFVIDGSKPIKRTWKNFIYMVYLVVLSFVALNGVLLLVSKSYIKGIVSIASPFAVLVLWYYICRIFHKKKCKLQSGQKQAGSITDDGEKKANNLANHD